MAHVQRSEGNSVELILSFYLYVSFKNLTQVSRLQGKCFYWLNHLAGSQLGFEFIFRNLMRWLSPKAQACQPVQRISWCQSFPLLGEVTEVTSVNTLILEVSGRHRLKSFSRGAIFRVIYLTNPMWVSKLKVL